MQPMQTATPVPHKTHLLRRVVADRSFKILVSLAILIIAVIVLRRMFHDINWADVKKAVSAYPCPTLGLSFSAMCISYLSLSLYDVILLRGVTEVKLPSAIPMMTGFSSMAVSNLLGFSWLTGGAIRYRIYSAFGVDIGAVARLIATSWVGFFIGVLTLVGGLMVLHPKGLSEVFPLSKTQETILGLIVVAGILGLYVWTAKTRRFIGFGSYKLELPLAAAIAKITAISILVLSDKCEAVSVLKKLQSVRLR
jgi:phosphatidylglycerol lysyltransferase